MKLSRFIKVHLEEILVEWEAFARTQQPPGANMSPLALRDHARQMLGEIVLDIDSHETPAEQYDKSQGLAPTDPDSPAAMHGTLRQLSGFSLLQLTAEFRALRATVLRMWLPQITELTDATTDDMVRFNETIDQALAESVVTYSERAARTRDMFLAMLGHDLRSPLATITLAGDYLTRPQVGTDETRKMGSRARRGAAAMSTMVNDLLEYARAQLGGEFPIVRQRADLRVICQAALDDARAGYPDCTFKLLAQGDLFAELDAPRLQQVVSNLLNNAAQYGTEGQPVQIDLHGEPEALVVAVSNHGPVIPAASLQVIFDPLVQLAVDEQQQEGRASTSMGLGLFIAQQITLAHGGTITVTSDELAGTVFTVKLPRQ
jgi:signal transduction histidine kinase